MRERTPEKNEKEPQSGPGNSAQTRKPVTVIAGDSVIQNIRGWSVWEHDRIPDPPISTVDVADRRKTQMVSQFFWSWLGYGL